MLTLSEFGVLFEQLNKWYDNGFLSWFFELGMNYSDKEYWWPSYRQKRPVSHEGIDFFWYVDGHGQKRPLGQAKVPCPCDGKVLALCEDFLGQSVFILNADPAGKVDLFAVAHIIPSVRIGQRVKCGDLVGVIAPGQGRVPGHLHVSALYGDWHDLPRQLTWPALNKQKGLHFVNPFEE